VVAYNLLFLRGWFKEGGNLCEIFVAHIIARACGPVLQPTLSCFRLRNIQVDDQGACSLLDRQGSQGITLRFCEVRGVEKNGSPCRQKSVELPVCFRVGPVPFFWRNRFSVQANASCRIDSI